MQLRAQRFLPCFVIGATLLSGLIDAAANTVTFDVKNIDFHITSFNGSSPLGVLDYLGSAQFTWIYTAGDFANGAGALNFVTNPFDGSPGAYPTTDVADLTGLSTTLANANVQNLSYDISVKFAGNLTDPNSSTVVNGGSFDITGNYPGSPSLSGEFVGVITDGRIASPGGANVSEPDTCALVLAGLGIIGFNARRRK